MKHKPVESDGLRTLSALAISGLAALLGFASPIARAADAQLYRIRADAATTITSVLPNGQITWTSAVPNINYTVEAFPGGQSGWGAVFSGVQSGFSQTFTLYRPAGPANVIAVRTLFHTNILAGMQVSLVPSSTWQTRAQAVTGLDGRCYFYGMPPDDYYVEYPDSAVYSAGYWDSQIIDGVQQTNRMDVYVTKRPVVMQPTGTISSAPTFLWNSIPEAAYYSFDLYASGASTPLDSVSGLFQTNYQTTANLVANQSYYWFAAGYNIRGEPVLRGQGNFLSGFTGPGGGTNKAGCDQRLFGVIQWGKYPVAGVGIHLSNSTNNTLYYPTTTDSQGWYLFEGVAAGLYSLVLESTNYTGQTLSSYVLMPDYAGHFGVYYLSKPAANMQPAAHTTVHSSTPIFSWSGAPECAIYTVTVRNWNTGVTIFTQPNLTANSLLSPVALANADYFWSVQGFDSDGNMLLTGTVRITIHVP